MRQRAIAPKCGARHKGCKRTSHPEGGAHRSQPTGEPATRPPSRPGPRTIRPGPRTIQPGPRTIQPGPRTIQPGPRTIQPGPDDPAGASNDPARPRTTQRAADHRMSRSPDPETTPTRTPSDPQAAPQHVPFARPAHGWRGLRKGRAASNLTTGQASLGRVRQRKAGDAGTRLAERPDPDRGPAATPLDNDATDRDVTNHDATNPDATKREGVGRCGSWWPWAATP
jgi:hypothetical protein